MPVLGSIFAEGLGGPKPKSYVKKKNYVFGKIIDSGSFAVVRKAKRKSTGEFVAVKVIKKQFDKDGKPSQHQLARVATEVKIAGNVRHPGIVCLQDFFESRKKFYLVFDLISGGTLKDALENRGPYAEANAVHLVRSLLNVVCHLHSRQVVHRDIKPENIMFQNSSEDQSVILCDFGISKILDADHGTYSFVGSYGYMGPEVLARRAHGFPLDIWCIGSVTSALLSGSSPYENLDGSYTFSGEYSEAVQIARVRFEGPRWSRVSPLAKDFILKCLSADPTQRITAKTALEHLWLRGAIPLSRTLSLAKSTVTLVDSEPGCSGGSVKCGLLKTYAAVDDHSGSQTLPPSVVIPQASDSLSVLCEAADECTLTRQQRKHRAAVPKVNTVACIRAGTGDAAPASLSPDSGAQRQDLSTTPTSIVSALSFKSTATSTTLVSPTRDIVAQTSSSAGRASFARDGDPDFVLKGIFDSLAVQDI